MSRRNEEWRRNRHGDQWRRNREEDESGWGNERFRRPGPRGLKGKDIGLYYRNLNKYGKKKPDLTITLTVPNIVTTKLKNNLDCIGKMIERDLDKKPILFKSEIENVPSTSKYGQDDDVAREPDVKQIKIEPDYLSQPGPSSMPDFIPIDQKNPSYGSDDRILTLRGAGDYKYGYHDIITETFAEKLTECLAKGIDIAKKTSDITRLNESLYENQHRIFQSPQYKEMLKFRQTLPAYKKSTELRDIIQCNQVVVISGETGCGKSTQVPQIILEDAIINKKGANVKILVTQPRRIAASSLAARVSKERGEPMGNSVGYAVRLEKVEPRPRGSIMFCTTGILLVDLEVNQGLTEYSHIILDEVHERDAHIDLAMCMLKQVLQKRKDLKLILMSATLDANTLCSYFNNCPLMHIEGLAYPVEDLYLEDILRLTQYQLPEKPPPKFQKSYVKHLRKTKEALRENTEKELQYIALIGPWLESIKGDIHPTVYKTLKDQRIEDLNIDLIYELVKYICKGPEGAILIFLPGINEITKFLKLVATGGLEVQYEIHPVHSKLPTLEQNKIFERPPKQIRKIIVATNIAETSITIDDIVYVIDCGKIKYSGLNVEQHVNTLKTEWVSKANLHQRRGRAGRCQPGICYHLLTSRRAELLEDRLLPELQRTDLLEPLLTIKRLRLGKAAEALRDVPDSPAATTIERAVLHLQQCGALDDKETLTPLGWHMARLPVHPAAGKLLILGALFGCLDRAASVAAVWSFKDPFLLVLEKEDEVKAAKRALAQGEPSDHVAISEAMIEYERCQWADRRTFAYQYFLSISTMELLCEMKKQLGGNLRAMGFLASGDVKSSWENRNTSNLSLFKAIIAAALYPNIVATRWKNLYARNINKQVRVGAVDPNGPVSIHPSSLMCPPKRKPNKKFAPQVQLCSSPGANWLVYWLKQRSSELFLIDVTLVYSLPLLFFGQLKQIESTDEDHCTVCITSFKVQMRKDTAELLFKLRELLDDVLAAKIGSESNHAVQHSEFEEQVLNAVITVITAEDERAEYLDGSESDTSERDYRY